MLTNNKKDVTVKVNDIKSIKSIQKKINENDKKEVLNIIDEALSDIESAQ